jgi:hypothetical protein
MFVKITAKPVDIVLVKVYMPKTNCDDDEVEKLYDVISDILYPEGKRLRECHINRRLQQNHGRSINR